jgi:hypothetical protein
LDMISIARRLEVLSKNRLAEVVDVADGAKVYALPGFAPTGVSLEGKPKVSIAQTASGEKMYRLEEN